MVASAYLWSDELKMSQPTQNITPLYPQKKESGFDAPKNVTES
jgi:hypothetical protein